VLNDGKLLKNRVWGRPVGRWCLYRGDTHRWRGSGDEPANPSANWGKKAFRGLGTGVKSGRAGARGVSEGSNGVGGFSGVTGLVESGAGPPVVSILSPSGTASSFLEDGRGRDGQVEEVAVCWPPQFGQWSGEVRQQAGTALRLPPAGHVGLGHR